jgi:long-chain acyl-CoA synthetase
MGSGEPQPFAVVMLAESVRGRLSKGESREDIGRALAEAHQRINGQLNEWERLGYLVVARDEWTIGSGLLTPTMKIKRAAIEERYTALATERKGGGTVIWES